jgi:hypothetical protein
MTTKGREESFFHAFGSHAAPMIITVQELGLFLLLNRSFVEQ